MPDKKPIPRLTESARFREFDRCAFCGTGGELKIWEECNEKDQPETKYLALCPSCTSGIMEPHPRLYVVLEKNAPAPGAMEICRDCKCRTGLSCSKAKVNGGNGIIITASKPGTYHMDGRGKDGKRWSKWGKHYESPPSACSGKEPGPCGAQTALDGPKP